MRPRLLLLTRPGCELCEELEIELMSHFGSETFDVSHADVDSDPEWRRRYGLKIPVLLADDGELLCSVRLDVDVVQAHLNSCAKP